MQRVGHWYIPQYDTHFRKQLEQHKFEYQRDKRQYALQRVRKFRLALDIGGNVGFWSRDMCERFERVDIFEPDTSNIECLKLNLESYNNYNIHQIGLGNTNTQKEFYKSNTCSGAHTFNPDHKPSDGFTKDFLEVKTLDSYNLRKIDFMKLDTQGSELEILEGAKQTLTNNKCLLNIEIEQKTPEQEKEYWTISKFMESINYYELPRFKKSEVLFAKRKIRQPRKQS